VRADAEPVDERLLVVREPPADAEAEAPRVGESLLQLRALLGRELPGLHGGVDPGGERVRERRAQLLRSDPETRGDVVDERRPVRGARGSGGEPEGRDGGEDCEKGAESSHVDHSFRRGHPIEAAGRS
jgi:hypothetical protein